MEAKLRLAINTKLYQIFNSDNPEDDKFVSFPSEAYIFNPEELNLMLREKADDMVSSINTMSDLSRIVNFPVRDIYDGNHSTDEVLWDVYGEVLKTAELALSNSDVDEAEFQKAMNALYDTDESGIQMPSERYMKYCELRDKKYTTKEIITRILKSDEQDQDKEALAEAKRELSEIERDLAANNLEREMQDMEEIRNRVTRNDPASVWEERKHQYNPDISLQSTLELIEYAPTYIYPTNILKQDWDTIKLSKSDIDALTISAPKKLKDASRQIVSGPRIRLLRNKNAYRSRRLEDSSINEEGVSFEYRSVKLERPWFDASLFSSRYWRFPANSGQGALAFAGHNGSVGRFPSYISALVLVKNLKTISGEQLLEDGYVMAMAYICKWLPACPDPDPNANWGSGFKATTFTLVNSNGGTVSAKSGNNRIDTGLCDVGAVIKLMAKPAPDYYLSYWLVNDKEVKANDGKLECIVTEEGLRVVPVWAVAQKAGDMTVSVRGKTLVSISGGPNDLDMNVFNETNNIETIEENAFSGYTNLHRIQIGSRVNSIGREAFRGCKDLKHVRIPAATNSIANNAFLLGNNQDNTIFEVDKDNIVYTAIDGQLVERRRTALMHTIRCRCGSSFYYNDQMPVLCPQCGAELDNKNAVDKNIQIPDEVVPFKLVTDEATEKINTFLKKKGFADPAFRQAVAETDFAFDKVYIPYWEWNIQASGSFDIEVTHTKTVKGADGQNKTVTEKERVTEKASCPEEHVFVPASKLVKEKTLRTSNADKKAFAPEPTDVYEMYSCSSKQSLATARKSVSETLQMKAKENVKGGDSKTIVSEDIEYTSENSILTALPYWSAAMTYMDKRYSFLVDGYSGAVTARDGFPKNKKKIWITVGICTAVVALIVALIVLFGGKGSAKAGAMKTDPVETSSGENGNLSSQQIPVGALNGAFSVSDTKKVRFSKGNLQYQATTNTWRFAENQWDFVGGKFGKINNEDCLLGTVYENGMKCDNSLISSDYSGWIDLFGWDIRGIYQGAKQPRPTSTDTKNHNAYDDTDYSGDADWGYNSICISNGGNTAGQWRALSNNEWEYLLFQRSASTINGIENARYVFGTINNIGLPGLILLPDVYNHPKDINRLSGINQKNKDSLNRYSIEEWSMMEKAGCVFLPESGCRNGNKYTVRIGGHPTGGYWTDTQNERNSAYFFAFNFFRVSTASMGTGLSVRLVQDINKRNRDKPRLNKIKEDKIKEDIKRNQGINKRKRDINKKPGH